MARFQWGTEIRDVVLEADRLEYCERQRALFAAGWQRVRDPAREAEFPDDPRDEALEHAIREDFDNDENWLVYADHLIERGHPRGQLVAIESAPAKNIVQRAEREAEARRIRQATDLGTGLVGRGLALEWRRGYIHTAKLHGGFPFGAAEDVLFDLLRHPSGRFLRVLVIGCWHRDAQDHRLLVDLLLHTVPAPPLRKLSIEYRTDSWHGFPPLGNLGKLGTIYPQLEDVYLDGDNTVQLAGPALPRATRFGFGTSELQPHTLKSFASAPWPALEELELSLFQSPCGLEALRWIFTLPKLRRLRILGATFANELVEQLVASPIAAQIELLDLRQGTFDARGMTALLDARARFPAKLACVLPDPVSSDDRQRLRDAGVEIDRW